MTRTAERRIRIEEKTSQHAVRDVLAKALAQLAEWQVPAASVGHVQIVLAEVLNNVVEHAYGFEDGGAFSLDMTLDGGCLTCIVRDSGAPFPDGSLPKGDAVPLDGPAETLPEGGFGWFMIRELTESLSYDNTKGCNLLTLRFKVV